MRKLLFLIAFGCLQQACEAQVLHFKDSLRTWFAAKPSFTMSLDGRSSFIGASAASVLGGRLGWDYGRVGVYAGLYTLQRRIFSLQYSRPGDTLYRRLGMTYASATFEYLFYKDTRWELKIPAQLGMGLASKTNIRNGVPGETVRVFMFPLEAQMTALYRLTRYLGISAGLGFRMANGAGPSYNGSIYSIGATVFTGTLYKDWRKSREEQKPLKLF
ncbi:MAG: hypothetical protein KJS92_03235 [Bacteroidetes bacterium]|nr:hypothetical protein [Bacteroidota bacterium]